jgi:uncharacterized protein (DUF1919 family)
MKTTPKFINEEGIYEPEMRSPDFLTHKPLKYLIENNLVFQDENGDWVLVEYCEGTSNEEDWNHWRKTGYKRSWSVTRWESNVNLNELNTSYSIETKDGWDRKYFKIKLNNHFYFQIINPDGYWSETVTRTDIDGGYGDAQLYYQNKLEPTLNKIPVKIGKKVQELKNKGI